MDAQFLTCKDARRVSGKKRLMLYCSCVGSVGQHIASYLVVEMTVVERGRALPAMICSGSHTLLNVTVSINCSGDQLILLDAVSGARTQRDRR